MPSVILPDGGFAKGWRSPPGVVWPTEAVAISVAYACDRVWVYRRGDRIGKAVDA
jgi:hypothetical protein